MRESPAIADRSRGIVAHPGSAHEVAVGAGPDDPDVDGAGGLQGFAGALGVPREHALGVVAGAIADAVPGSPARSSSGRQCDAVVVFGQVFGEQYPLQAAAHLFAHPGVMPGSPLSRVAKGERERLAAAGQRPARTAHEAA